jgi:hypothetical protein
VHHKSVATVLWRTQPASAAVHHTHRDMPIRPSLAPLLCTVHPTPSIQPPHCTIATVQSLACTIVASPNCPTPGTLPTITQPTTQATTFAQAQPVAFAAQAAAPQAAAVITRVTQLAANCTVLPSPVFCPSALFTQCPVMCHVASVVQRPCTEVASPYCPTVATIHPTTVPPPETGAVAFAAQAAAPQAAGIPGMQASFAGICPVSQYVLCATPSAVFQCPSQPPLLCLHPSQFVFACQTHVLCPPHTIFCPVSPFCPTQTTLPTITQPTTQATTFAQAQAQPAAFAAQAAAPQAAQQMLFPTTTVLPSWYLPHCTIPLSHPYCTPVTPVTPVSPFCTPGTHTPLSPVTPVTPVTTPGA